MIVQIKSRCKGVDHQSLIYDNVMYGKYIFILFLVFITQYAAGGAAAAQADAGKLDVQRSKKG